MNNEFEDYAKSTDPAITVHRESDNPEYVFVTASEDRLLISVHETDGGTSFLDFKIVDGKLVLNNEGVR